MVWAIFLLTLNHRNASVLSCVDVNSVLCWLMCVQWILMQLTSTKMLLMLVSCSSRTRTVIRMKRRRWFGVCATCTVMRERWSSVNDATYVTARYLLLNEFNDQSCTPYHHPFFVLHHLITRVSASCYIVAAYIKRPKLNKHTNTFIPVHFGGYILSWSNNIQTQEPLTQTHFCISFHHHDVFHGKNLCCLACWNWMAHYQLGRIAVLF